ncbi:hypothetical protein [Actinobaculum sp. 352]|uniref:hypothetical protein n=1 Tax=Actinobaculum sp. 352 TaxID=2490946 RepID=UPI000F7EECBA|nr:hypothetical protein [Actinobaculum sp. 352]RTE49614.1 hypothetical protein EKN07_06105 [Actinobaculum sp. 352]
MSTNNTTSPQPAGKQYPECAKWNEAADYAFEILNFLEYLEKTYEGMYLYNVDDGRAYLSYETATENLVYEYYGIDKTLLEAERRDKIARLNDTLASIDGGDAA